MSLPAGVFWCWTDNLTTDIWLSTAHPMSRKATGISLVGKGLFLRIFGVVPKPGEALKLDDRYREWTCCECGEVHDAACEKSSCGKRRTDEPLHARILDRKPLEGKE